MAKLPFSAETAEVIKTAGREAGKLGHSYVGTEHMLLALLRQSCTAAGRVLGWMGWDYSTWQDVLVCARGKGDGRCALVQGFSPGAGKILAGAGREARALCAEKVEPEHVLLAMSRDESCTAVKLMKQFGGDMNLLFSDLYNSLQFRNQIGEESVTTLKLTEQFCEDMVAAAATASPVIGRDAETETLMEILCRKHKNNPALVGDPGVGKTAIVEGLAQRMAAGRVPERLRQKRLLSLNLASLLAGTKYRGEFEERVRDMVQEIRKCGNVILFIDEMHTLVGAGSAEGAIDAANLLKPALSRGDIQVIGATTMEEYRKYIEKDAALERRFRPITVHEPSREETRKILEGLRPGLEEHHGIAITEEAVEAAVELSCRYMVDRFLPDKAVDLLDEGASRVRMEHLRTRDPSLEQKRQELTRKLGAAVRADRFEEAAFLRDELQAVLAKQTRKSVLPHREVTAQDIAETVAVRTGIPVSKLSGAERKSMQELEQQLRSRVIGQDEAVKAVAAAVRRGRMGLRDERRPVASMLFMGPSGVGKTQLCKALAETVYGTADALVRLDMSEYMEKHTVSRLLGAPPGYVGHGEAGLLTEQVRKRPYCVVLLDEIEKAHPDICAVLLQVMDDGILTDAMGRKADFRSAMVIMTSNLGGSGGALGFEKKQNAGREAACLRERFSPEFLGRIDCVAQFHPLDEAAMERIAALQMEYLVQRAGKNGLQLQSRPALCRHLARQCGKEGGARQLRRLIREQVENPLADLLLASDAPASVILDASEERVLLTSEP